MRKSLLIFLVAIFATSIAFADNIDKLSISTQIFLGKLNGTIQVDDESLRSAKAIGLKPVAGTFEAAEKEGQFVADPVVLDGQTYMSAFLRVEDESVVSELESLGVMIECRFLEGKLFTALIPVDKIEKVATIAKVKRVNAAKLMRSSTYVARQKTNVDDILTYSADAQSAGLPNGFDGSGVVLGVIDTGIDFNHIAFKDASGNSRIKQAYVYNGSTANTYTGSQITSSLTDDKTADHGTHTSSTAGGSSVIVNGTTVTVTNDHANATYGGMAPGADLFLAGVNGLSDTHLSNALDAMCTYADNQGLPLVVSNSWGSQWGPHDGTGETADVYNEKFGDSHPNRVALFAASNDGGKSKDNEGGGYHVMGTASSSSPLSTICRSASYTNTDGGYYYYGPFFNAWSRSTSTSSLAVKIYVLNANTGAVVTSVTVTPTSTQTQVSGLSSYYSGTLYVLKDYVDSDKTQLMLYTSGLTSRSTSTTTQNGSTYYKSSYTLAVQVYPTSGSCTIDAWGGNYGYFTNHLSTSGYSWTAGTDDGCYSDEATIANIISIGAYASLNGGMDNSYTIGDIADFSSWGTTTTSLTGEAYPWITAPGARLIAGVNHNHTASVDSYSYYGSNFNGDLVVNSSTNPYAYMEGTSMATPTAAGIVALWLQASLSDNAKSEYKNSLTVNKVKQIMAQTAIHDSYTDTGANADHFGNGKIDALAGIAEILDNNSPVIKANPTAVAFGDQVAGGTYTQTFTVTGANLEGNITLAKSGSSAFTIDKTSVTKATAEGNGATVTVTFKPTAGTTANYTGTVTLTSSNATSLTVSLTGKGVYTAPAITANPTSLSFTGNSGTTYTKTVTVTGTNLQGNITAAISGDANGFYSVSPTTINNSNGSASRTVTVTWAPTAGGTSTANLVLTTTGTGASSVTVPITGTAQGPTITANPTSVTFTGAYATRTYTQAVTVTGTNLTQDITAAISGANVYSIDKTSLTTTSGTITVTYAPIAAGNTTATLTLSSTGASSVTVPITGTAQAATPTLVVSPASLTFSTDLENSQQQTFAVTGRFIDGAVNVALTDANGVFTVSPASIPAASISETTPVNVTVTFQSATEGSYTGTITLTSDGAESKTVTLNATANDGGTASDAYLNIAKYATIDEAGATVSGMSSIYKYTEYADDACAWLTVSNYGAQQADANQNWLETKSLKGYSNTWSATDIFLGNGSYFTSGGYSIYGSGNQIFYVTNCTQVKSMIKDGNANATLAIYECTKGSDGTLTAATTATDTKTGNCSSSSPNVITSSTIDASKIYKVVLTGGGSYPDLLEIGFKTPLNPLGMPAITNVAPTTTTAEVTWTSGENNVGWNLRYRVYVEQENSTPFFESFENGLNEWTLVDTDGDGNNWRQFDPTNFSNSSYTAYDGQYVAMSRSWQNSTVLTPDQWMISPRIEDLGGTLKYYIMDDGSYQEKYRIYVSTSGTDISSFQPVTEDMYSPASTTWTEVAIDLSQYAGKAGYIGFRHYDCSDEDFMLIDALGLYKGSEGEWIYVNNVTSPYTIDGLTPETTYEVQVQGIGDNGKTSSWTASTIFTTLGGIPLAELERNGTVGTYTISDELVAVYAAADKGLLWCKDQGDASIDATEIKDGQIDYMKERATENEYWQRKGDWDQSNWVLLKFPEPTQTNGIQSLLENAVGKTIASGSLTGRYINDLNYTIEVLPVDNVYTLSTGSDAGYVKNLYCTANFLESNLNLTDDSKGAEGVRQGQTAYYFFMNPKVQEVCEITYAEWDGNNTFVVPDNDSQISGALTVDWSYNAEGIQTPAVGTPYRFVAVVNRTEGSTYGHLKDINRDASSNFVIYPLNFTAGNGNVITAINRIDGSRDVVDVYYVNSTGLMSKTPFQGVNIIVTRYSDGSRTTVKKVFK